MPKTRPAGESKANVKNDPGLKEFLRIQEKLTEDYLGISRGKLKKKRCAHTLVRGPNGELLVVGKKRIIPVKDQDQVDRFLEDLNDLVSDYIAKHIDPRLVAGPGVHVGTPEIFPK
jgi:hypothetical protein